MDGRLLMSEPEEKYEIENCQRCGELILETNHECEEPLDEKNYSDRLKRGFDMLEMED